MPHVVIEYSANVADHVDISALVDAVHSAALATGLPALAALRTRAVGRDHYRIADGQANHAFVAIAARIGPGRSDDDKSSFLETVLAAAQTELGDNSGHLAIAYSIELQEIDPRFRINDNRVRARMESQD